MHPKELTIVNRTNPRNLIGRTEDLQHLRQLLSEEKQITLVNGMGGIGKTTLAEAYVFENYDKYDHIAWITNNSEALSDDFVQNRELLQNLNLHNAGLEPQPLFEEMMRRMKNLPEKNNLLIIDNAVKASVTPFLQKLPSPPGWHLLVTSRERIPGMTQKNLSFLSPEEANALFKKHCQLIRDEDFIDEITAAVEYHTLTIEILAKTTARMHLTPEQVRNALKTDAETDLDDVKRSEGATIKKVTSFLASIFELSDLSEDEIWMLKQFSCLPPDFFKLEFLKDLINPEEKKAAIFLKIMNSLTDKGWLLKSNNWEWKMHRIVGEIVQLRAIFSSSEVLKLFDIISDRISYNRIKDNPIEKIRWIPFAKILLERFKELKFPKKGRLQNNLAVIHQTLSNYSSSKVLFEEALAFSILEHGEFHIRTAIQYSNLATANQSLGNFYEAKKLLEKSIPIHEKYYGKEHAKTSVSYSILGLIYQDLGDYAKANKLFSRVVKVFEKQLGKNHPDTAQGYSNLGLNFQDIGQYKKAEKLLKKALNSNISYFGREHPITMATYMNLATILQKLKKFEKAKKHISKAVAFYEKNYGKSHSNTLLGYSNLASVHQNLGNYSKAQELIELSLNTNLELYGLEYLPNGALFLNLAVLNYSIGNFEKAYEMNKKALKIFRKYLPENHPNVLNAKEGMRILSSYIFI